MNFRASVPGTAIVIAMALAAGVQVSCEFGRRAWDPRNAAMQGHWDPEDVLPVLRDRVSGQFPDLEQLTDGQPIALLAFKEERSLEFWKRDGRAWRRVKKYPFTGYSGKPGPKLEDKDGQIPEGIYPILKLNANSRYHLSLKVGYPNAFDREMAARDGRVDPGSHIFIHGKSESIGCIPIGDPAIEELFYIVAENGYRNTWLIISPCDMRVRTKHPSIPGIDWESELYERIEKALRPFRS